MSDESLFFGPCSEKQRLVLMDDSTDVVLTGGGSGSGKSRMCLTKAIKYIQDPAARVMIIRQSYPTLKLSGGLVDMSKDIFPHFGGTYKEQAMKWVFDGTNGSAAGATIQFGAIPDNLAEWQGLAATHMLVDEAAEFSEQQIMFLLTRLRSARFKGHMCLMMTANPDINSFLKPWVDYCLDPDTGVPKPGTEYIIRYFVTIRGKMYWDYSEDALYAQCGTGLTRGKDFIPKSFRFIPMTVYDNPVLMKNDPGYLASLLAQPRVSALRFLYGSWTAKPENSGVFNRDWVQIVDSPPVNAIGRVRSWDLASSVPSETNNNPDYTAGVKLSRDPYGVYYVEDVQRFRKLSDGVLKEIIAVAKDDGPDTQVTIPRDPGSGAKVANQFFTRVLAEAGIPARSIVVSGHTSKSARFAPFCTLAESGSVRIVRGSWVEDFLRELEYYEPGNRNQKDDQVDAVGDAFNTLCKSVSLPTFTIPMLDQPSPIPTM